jgi:hypothetical protein
MRPLTARLSIRSCAVTARRTAARRPPSLLGQRPLIRGTGPAHGQPSKCGFGSRASGSDCDRDVQVHVLPGASDVAGRLRCRLSSSRPPPQGCSVRSPPSASFRAGPRRGDHSPGLAPVRKTGDEQGRAAHRNENPMRRPPEMVHRQGDDGDGTAGVPALIRGSDRASLKDWGCGPP